MPQAHHVSGRPCSTHSTYLLTCEEYDDLWERAGGRCEACGHLPIPERASDYLVIDHDHRYGAGAVRGLICQWCNGALGRLENPRIAPAFGPGPGRHFERYLRQAWFVRRQDSTHTPQPMNRPALREELRGWRRWCSLLSGRRAGVVVSTQKPAEAARTLRDALSPVAYAALLRAMTDEKSVDAQAPVALVVQPESPPEETFGDLRSRAAALREALDEMEEAIFAANRGSEELIA